jgi:hypothetical protein
VIDQKAHNYQVRPNAQVRLTESDLKWIVRLSKLQSQSRLTRVPIPSRVVSYSGHQYKVRAYPDGEAAQQRLELIGAAEHLFTRCHGRVDRYLVFEYIDGGKVAGNGPSGACDATESRPYAQILLGIPAFLCELAARRADNSLEHDFDFLCGNIESAGIFRPRTIELVRRYYTQVQSRPIASGLEYYDAMPRNFALIEEGLIEEGKLASIDEKHLRVGPRGVSLIKPMEQLPQEDFSKLKEAYLAKLESVPFDDPEYRRFLRFYRHLTALGVLAAYRAREINMYEHSFHLNRRTILGIIGASPSTRLGEEAPWLRYWWHETKSVFRRALGFLWRRLIRVLASAGKA